MLRLSQVILKRGTLVTVAQGLLTTPGHGGLCPLMPLGREFTGSALGNVAGRDLLLFLFSFFKGKLIMIQEKEEKPQLCSAEFSWQNLNSSAW